jgi:hypothetical protein
MRTTVVSWVIALLMMGCSGQSTAASPTHSPVTNSSLHSAAVVDGGCGSTSVAKGHVPSWLDEAGAHNNPDFLPYVVAVPADAAGFIFGYPLRAGHPENPSNKILWVVRLPRGGSGLEITGHPADATKPTIDVAVPANSGPGEIYPSIVDVPQPGCWHFDLAWAGHHAAVELMYQ